MKRCAPELNWRVLQQRRIQKNDVLGSLLQLRGASWFAGRSAAARPPHRYGHEEPTHGRLVVQRWRSGYIDLKVCRFRRPKGVCLRAPRGTAGKHRPGGVHHGGPSKRHRKSLICRTTRRHSAGTCTGSC